MVSLYIRKILHFVGGKDRDRRSPYGGWRRRGSVAGLRVATPVDGLHNQEFSSGGRKKIQLLPEPGPESTTVRRDLVQVLAQRPSATRPLRVNLPYASASGTAAYLSRLLPAMAGQCLPGTARNVGARLRAAREIPDKGARESAFLTVCCLYEVSMSGRLPEGSTARSLP